MYQLIYMYQCGIVVLQVLNSGTATCLSQAHLLCKNRH